MPTKQNNNKINFNNLSENNPENIVDQEKEEPQRKIDIKKYQDPEGLTLNKMSIGLWFVQNRKNLITLLFGVLVLIASASWLYFFVIFGHYVTIGIKQDKAMAREIIQDNLVGHDFVSSFVPRDIQIKPVQVLKLEDNKYDFVAQITNSNLRHWAEIYYYFRAGNENLAFQKTFIMPNEAKYILSLGEEFGSAGSASFVIEDVKWHRLDAHQIPDWEEYRKDHLDITVSDTKFTPAKSSSLSEKISLNDLSFSVQNNTPFNYWDVYFVALLKDRSKIIGVNKYILTEFLSDQKRDINVTWPGRLGSVREIEILPEVNIFDKNVYIDFDLPGEVK